MVEVNPKSSEIRISFWKYFLFLLFMLLLLAGLFYGIYDSQWGASNSYAEWFRKYLGTLNRFRPNAKPEDNLANALRIHGLERLPNSGYALLFSVTDSNGEPVANLQKTQVTIATGDPGTQPKPVAVNLVSGLGVKTWTDKMTFGAVMDYSGSMFPTDLDAIETNYGSFINSIAFPFAGAVFKFHHSVEEVQAVTTSLTDIEAALKKRIQLGNTALYLGMDQALEKVKTRPHLRFLLLTTDGNNNVGGVTLEDVIKKSRQAYLSTFVLGFGWLNVNVLKKIADETDGYYVYVPDSGDLKTWFPKIAKIVNNIQVAEFSTTVDIQPTSPLELAVTVSGNTLKRTR